MFGRVTEARRRLRRERFSVYIYAFLLLMTSSGSHFQIQTEDNNLGALVAVVRSFRYIHLLAFLPFFSFFAQKQ